MRREYRDTWAGPGPVTRYRVRRTGLRRLVHLWCHRPERITWRHRLGASLVLLALILAAGGRP
jgi:hypothetical protein